MKAFRGNNSYLIAALLALIIVLLLWNSWLPHHRRVRNHSTVTHAKSAVRYSMGYLLDKERTTSDTRALDLPNDPGNGLFYDVFHPGREKVHFRLPVGVDGYRTVKWKRSPLGVVRGPDWWLVFSVGPDRTQNIDLDRLRDLSYDDAENIMVDDLYDPTNGTVSAGDIAMIRPRFSRNSREPGHAP